MPLKHFGEQLTPYLRRDYIRVSAEDREEDESRSPFDYTVRLKEVIQDVVSIELVGYDFSSALAPTFLSNLQSRRPFLQDEGMHLFNLRIYHSNATDFVDIVVDMQQPGDPDYDYSDVLVEFIGGSTSNRALEEAITQALTNQGNAFVNIGNTTPHVRQRESGQLDIFFIRTGPTPVNSVISFPSAGSAARPLGFADDSVSYASVTNTDYATGTGTNQVITSPQSVNQQPTRFIDVHLRETPELQPLARVYIERPYAITAQYDNARMPRMQRILTDSLRRLEKLTISLTTGDEKRVIPLTAPIFNSLVFEVVSLRPAGKCEPPYWVKQAFVL